jgi:hypothetical protein
MKKKNVWIKGEYYSKAEDRSIPYEYICSFDRVELERSGVGSDCYIHVNDIRNVNTNVLVIIVTEKEWLRIARLKMDEECIEEPESEPVSAVTDNLEGIEL